MSAFKELVGAVYRGEIPVIQELLEAGLELNLLDADGRTVLMHAVLADDPDPEMVRFLVEHGADLHAADKGQHWTALHFAARDQNREVVAVLLELGAAVDPIDLLGNTPLWRAVMNYRGDAELIRLLLEHGAAPGRKNNYGNSPLDTARTMGNEELVSLLSS